MLEEQLKKIEDLIQVIVKVVFGTTVKTQATLDGLGVKLQIIPDDYEKTGVILGRNGENLNALRRLVRVWGFNHSARIHLFIAPEDTKVGRGEE